MALLNKHNRLSIDPCILKSAQDIIDFAHEVARKSDHTTSDLLVTAIWCCMNCSCNQNINKEDKGEIDVHSKPDKYSNNTDKVITISNNEKEKLPDSASINNITDTEKTVKQKHSEKLTSTDQSSKTEETNHSTIATTKDDDKHLHYEHSEEIIFDMDNMCALNAENPAETILPNEKKFNQSSDNSKEGNQDHMQNDSNMEVIVLDEEEEEDKAEEKTLISKSGVLIETQNGESGVKNDDYDYFDMDCDEIDEDQQFDSETCDKSREQSDAKKKQSEDEDITVISDDENTNNKECASNSQTNDTKGKLCKDSNQTGLKVSSKVKEKTDLKQQKAEEPEVINLDSDSEPERVEKDNTITEHANERQESGKADNSYVRIKTESDTLFTEEHGETAMQKHDNPVNDESEVEPFKSVSAAEALGLRPIKCEPETNMTVQSDMPVLQSLDYTNVSSFGPFALGLVPKHEHESEIKSRRITATTVTSWAFNQGPSLMLVTQGPSVIMNAEDIPPVKKRLLDFDKKWHTAPKLDRHQDRYLALPGGIEGNSVDSLEDRHRKLAARNDVSEWMPPGGHTSISDEPSVPTVEIENDWSSEEDSSSRFSEHYSHVEKEDESDELYSDEDKRKKGKRKKMTKNTQGATLMRIVQKNMGHEKKRVPRKVAPERSSSRGRRKVGRGKVSLTEEGKGKGRASSSPSKGSLKKNSSVVHMKKIGFYSVRRGAEECQTNKDKGATRGRGRGPGRPKKTKPKGRGRPRKT